METYAAEIVNGVVTQVIVGDATWAMERLNGLWVDINALVGIGWAWTETDGFVPPVVVEEPASE